MVLVKFSSFAGRAAGAALIGSVLTGASVMAQTRPVFTGPEGRPAVPGRIGDGPSLNQITDAFASKADATAVQPLINRSRMSVADYCPAAQVTGSGNNTACIQAAVTAFCALPRSGGVLAMPAGVYVVDANVGVQIPCQGVTIAGVGWGNRDDATSGTKILISGSGSAQIFNFTGASKDVDNRYAIGGGVRDLMFISGNGGATPTQLGAQIAFNHCLDCVVERVYSFGAYRFLTIFAGFNTRVTGSKITQVAAGGEAIKASGSDAGCAGNIGNCPGRLDLVQIDHTTIDAAFVAGSQTAACLRFSNFVATILISNVLCNQTSIGINADCPDSASIASCPQFITAYDFESEPNGIANSASAAGIVLTDVVHMSCDTCQLFGYTVDTLVILASSRFPGASDVVFSKSRIQSARRDCILSSVAGLRVTASQVLSCNQANVGGVAIETRSSVGGAAYSGSVTISDNQFCYEPASGGAPTSMGGVIFGSGTDYNIMQGNNFRGCNASYVDNSGGTHNLLTPNVGP